MNSKQYVEAAHTLILKPPAGTLVKSQGSETIFYNPVSNTFAAMNSAGVPKTMFKPDPSKHWFPTNLDWFNSK